ncbi:MULTISPECIES: hypothetical protein [Photorhabdus]|nr:hypothetical protein [Photorhabdus asymbiotica]RKS59396.1 hypothetical protein BDD30_1467 [Photorhabdus asymbiotica]
MNNRKFIFLMRDFIQSVKASGTNFDGNQALVGMYGEIECRIEDGTRVGLPGHLILLISLSKARLDPVKALELNGNFHLMLDSYIASINNAGYFLVRSFLIPEHTNQLHDYLNETVELVRNLMKEKLI